MTPTLTLRGRGARPLVQGGMGVGISAHRLAGAVAREDCAAINDYWHIDTGGPDASPDGGMMPRMHPQQPITNYVSIPSLSKAATKVEKLGGTVCKPKTAVPGMGYFAICLGYRGQYLCLWEMNDRTK